MSEAKRLPFRTRAILVGISSLIAAYWVVDMASNGLSWLSGFGLPCTLVFILTQVLEWRREVREARE